MSWTIDQNNGDIVISGWEGGVVDPPLGGISQMQNIDIVSRKGVAQVNYSLQRQDVQDSGTFTVNTSTDILTYVTSGGGILYTNQAITVSTSSALPSPLVASTTYYVIYVSNTTCQLSASIGGSAINITSTGTGIQSFSTINIGEVIDYAILPGSSGSIFFIDVNGRTWRYSTLVSTNKVYITYLNNDIVSHTGQGSGIALLGNVLLIFQGTNIHYATGSLFTGSPTWAYNWQTSLTSSIGHFAISAQDGAVYYCDQNQIGSIIATINESSFDPTNAATYTFNTTALALPFYETATCIAELGVNLVIGGQNQYIYPWDRVSTSYTYPIVLSEQYIFDIVSANTNIYIFAGYKGNIYVSNGSSVTLFASISQGMLGTPPGRIIRFTAATYFKNSLLFGFYVIANSNTPSSQATPIAAGVWEIDIGANSIGGSTELSIRKVNTFSAGNTTQVFPTAIVPLPNFYNQVGNPNSQLVIMGVGYITTWYNVTGPVTGIDGGIALPTGATTAFPYSDGSALIDTDLIHVGNFLTKKSFRQVEIVLAQPLFSGETVAVQYRENIFASFTPLSTATIPDMTSGFSYVYPADFETLQYIQFRVILTALNNTTAQSYCPLKEIRLR